MIAITDTTFGLTAKNDIRDRIDVEVGDAKSASFRPQMKVMRWDNEVNFSMRHVETDAETPTISLRNGVVIYAKPAIEVHQYDKADAGTDGGFEFEWVLKAVPASPILQATMQTKGLEFWYQDVLTQEQLDLWGDGRPANVIGSYAVYHATKGVLVDSAGQQYKTGKFCHIYRPEASDAVGQRVWCDLNIDVTNGLLAVTVPLAFLQSATYPIRVDPTFGYTSQGATSGLNNNKVIYIRSSTTPADSGTLDSVTVWANGTAGSPANNPALYSDSGATRASGRLAFSDSGGTAIPSGTNVEVTTNLTYASLTSGVQYWFGIHTSGAGVNYTNRYDSPGGAVKGHLESPDAYAFPATATAGGTWTDQVSMYGTYTAAGGGGTVRRWRMAMLGVS